MAFIRHIAIASENPAEAAEFYKKHFDMKELWRKPSEGVPGGASGVFLSDGWIYFAVLWQSPHLPLLGPDQTSDFLGIHHIGFLVEDQKATVAELDADGVRHVQEHPDAPPHPLSTRPEGKDTINEKFIGPDWIQFDVRDRGWNEIIAQGMQLYELKPVEKPAEETA